MTKILFFIPQLVGGGAEKVSMNIIKLIDQNIFDVHLVVTTMEGSVYNEIPVGIKVHDLKTPRTLFSILKLRKLIIMLSPDIIFSSLFRGHIALNISLFGLKKRPFVVLRSPNSPKLLFEYNKMDMKEKLLLENAYHRANLIVAQTPEMKDEIVEFHKIKKDKIKVFFNPIDIDMIDAKIKNTINPFSEEEINIVAAGRITYQKGFDVLINSFKMIVDSNPSYKLYIIGENILGEQEKLSALIDKLNLSNNVFF